MTSRHLNRWELDGVTGPVVVIDVLRAFTTAAFAFASGAESIYLVASVEEALEFKRHDSNALAMGEDRGRRPDGFDFPNSPVMLSRADLSGHTLVQRTSAGTQGILAATHAERLWAASLVCASATAAAVANAGIGSPAYVITGNFDGRDDVNGEDDRLTADLIERARLGQPIQSAKTADALVNSPEAERTLSLGPEHVDPLDIEYAAKVDLFDFAMEASRDEQGLRLNAVSAPPT